LRRRLLDGSIGVALCGFTNPRPSDIPDELLTRNVTMGRRAFRALAPDVDLSVCSIHDVPPGTSQMPQILRLAGFRAFAFSRPVVALRQKGAAPEFIWRGIDGTEIVCSCRPYSGMNRPDDFPHGYRADWPPARAWLAEQIGVARGPSGLAWLHRGADDSRPLRGAPRFRLVPSPDEPELDLLGLISRWNETEDVPIAFATPRDYFDALAERRDRLPVFEGVVEPAGWTYRHGDLGQHSLYLHHWSTTERLLALDKLHALETARTGVPFAAAASERRWRLLLRSTAHAGLWLFAEEYTRRLEGLRRLDESIERSLRRALRRLVPTPADGAAAALTFFNPHARRWTAVSEVDVRLADHANARAIRVTGPAGENVPCQIVAVAYDDIGGLAACRLALRVDLPSLGTADYLVHAAEPEGPADAAWERFTVLDGAAVPDAFEIVGHRVHHDAGRLTDIRSAAGAPVCTGSVFDLTFQEIRDEGLQRYHYGELGGLHRFEPKVVRLVEDGPVRRRLWVRGRVGPHMAEHLLTFSPYQAWIEVETRLSSSGGSGEFRLSFPLPEDARLHAGALFGHEPRDPDAEPYVGIERLRPGGFYAHRWLDVGRRTGEAGAAGAGLAVVMPPGSFGWVKTEGTVDYILHKSVQLQDEAWEAKSSVLREGTGYHAFRWFLVPHGPGSSFSALHRTALSLVAPLPYASRPAVRSVRAAGPAQRPPGLWEGVRIEPDDVVVSALYRDGRGGALLRLYDSGGAGGTCALTLGFTLARAEEVDLNGDPLPPDGPGMAARVLRHEGARLALSLRPWEIVTLRLRVA
jgi:hypothetical protein